MAPLGFSKFKTPLTHLSQSAPLAPTHRVNFDFLPDLQDS